MNDVKDIRTIKSVLNLETGEEIIAIDFFNQEENKVWEYRRLLTDAINSRREPLFVCYFCKQLVRIRGGFTVNSTNPLILHFAHLSDSEKCPIKTNSNLTKEEWLRAKFNGAKESPLHFETKNYVGSFLSINKENGLGITECDIEKRHNNKSNYLEWRRPDITAIYRNYKLVFEIQLSTTFLSVIADREHFYKENQTYIIWVFKHFDTDADKQRFTQKDVFYSNNRNAFVLDNEAIEKSKIEKDLVLLCHYQKPEIIMGILTYFWKSEYIKLSDLTFDSHTYKVYYYDVTLEENKLKEQIKQKFDEDNRIKNEEKRIKEETKRIKELQDREKEKQRQEEQYEFRERIRYKYGELTELKELFLYSTYLRESVPNLFLRKKYLPTKEDKEFVTKEFRIAISLNIFSGGYWVLYYLSLTTFYLKVLNSNKYHLPNIMKIERLLFALLSFKLKKVIGYNYSSLLQMSHYILQTKVHTEVLLIGIEHYYGLQKFLNDDKTGKFEKKLNEYYIKKPEQHSRFNEVIKIIFPELILSK